MSSLIKQHWDRVVDSPGDNVLAEFSNVVDAVQRAVAVQNEFQTRNTELAENRRGVNVLGRKGWGEVNKLAESPTSTLEVLWKAWNRLRGRTVEAEEMIERQAPWKSYWLAVLAGVTVPFVFFFPWTVLIIPALGFAWGMAHVFGTYKGVKSALDLFV